MRLESVPMGARRALCVGYALFVTIACLLPKDVLEELPLGLMFLDKLAHAILYGLLCALLTWSLRENGGSTRRLLLAFAATALYGLVIEIVQGAVAMLGRTLSPGDMAANTAGCAAASLMILLTRQRHRAAPASAAACPSASGGGGAA